jgi:hypothetical protein
VQVTLYEAIINTETFEISFEEIKWLDYQQGEMVNSRAMLLEFPDGQIKRKGPWAPYCPYALTKEQAVEIKYLCYDARDYNHYDVYKWMKEDEKGANKFFANELIKYAVCMLWLKKNNCDPKYIASYSPLTRINFEERIKKEKSERAE